jgi:hypothetical protein
MLFSGNFLRHACRSVHIFSVQTSRDKLSNIVDIYKMFKNSQDHRQKQRNKSGHIVVIYSNEASSNGYHHYQGNL